MPLMHKKFFASIFALGFCVFLSQIIIIRELFVIFYGNELSLGIIFCFWLSGNGLGSFLSKKIIPKIKDHQSVFTISQMLLFFTLFTIIFFLKSSMILNRPAQGEIIGIGTMILNSFIFITPFCLLTGFLFPLACQIEDTFLNNPAKSAGYTYMLDTLGAGVAGIIGNFVLIKFLSTWHIVFIIGAILILNHRGNIILAFTSLCVALGILLITNPKPRWQEYKVLASESSIYGQITILEKENSISFYNNGLYIFIYPDKLSAEEIHLTALQNIESKNVLVIGGGLNGSLAELLKYKNIEEVVYVELDPLIIKLAMKLLPKEALHFTSDPRTSIINTDGRTFIKNTAKIFDLIIMNLPEPYTSSLNRFYTLEFFNEVKKILRANGVFSLSLPSGENYISNEQRRLLSSTYHTLKNVFPEVKVIPNGTNIFLSSPSKGQITIDGLILGERLTVGAVRKPPLHMSVNQIPFRLSQDRISQLNTQLQSIEQLNKDFSPINYFYDLLLWSSQISTHFVKIASAIEYIFTIENILGFTFAIGLGLLFLAKTRKMDFIPLSIASAGFTGISLELIISLVFQIVTGYLYFQLGLILASFMIGLACGSYFSTKSLGKIRNLNKTFNYLFSALAFYPMFLILFLHLRNINTIISLLILFVPSFIIGWLFPLANKISGSFGKLYACDLFGSAFGALLTTSVFIPLLGIYFTLVVIACVNIISLSLLVLRNSINHCPTNIFRSSL